MIFILISFVIFPLIVVEYSVFNKSLHYFSARYIYLSFFIIQVLLNAIYLKLIFQIYHHFNCDDMIVLDEPIYLYYYSLLF
jgi:hypothetical protein